jgi:hypothetical protein
MHLHYRTCGVLNGFPPLKYGPVECRRMGILLDLLAGEAVRIPNRLARTSTDDSSLLVGLRVWQGIVASCRFFAL